MREKVKIHDMYHVYMNESELYGRAKADLWLIEREINSLCISKETKQQEIDDLIENFKSKISKILKKILKLVEKAGQAKERTALNVLTDKVQCIQDHLNYIHSNWDCIVCFKEKKMQLFERKRQFRSIDRSFSTRAKSPMARLVRGNSGAQTPYGTMGNTGGTSKYNLNRTARDRSFTNLRLNNTVSHGAKLNTSYHSDTKLSLKKDKSLKYFFKSPNKDDLRQNSNNSDINVNDKYSKSKLNITNKPN